MYLNLPTAPNKKSEFGRGPAWANSLFEDNAEFGLGMKLALTKKQEIAELGAQLLNQAQEEVHSKWERLELYRDL